VECCDGPLRMAGETVRNQGLQRQVALRLGDGLAPVLEEDIDTVTIAGMGGTTIIGILERGRALWPRLNRIILQPMNGEAKLRRWALTQGWCLAAEDLVLEGGRWYQIVVLEPAKQPLVDLPAEIELIIGPRLLQERHPLLRQHIENLLIGYRQVVDNMANSQRARESARYQNYMQVIRQLEERLS